MTAVPAAITQQRMLQQHPLATVRSVIRLTTSTAIRIVTLWHWGQEICLTARLVASAMSCRTGRKLMAPSTMSPPTVPVPVRPVITAPDAEVVNAIDTGANPTNCLDCHTDKMAAHGSVDHVANNLVTLTSPCTDCHDPGSAANATVEVTHGNNCNLCHTASIPDLQTGLSAGTCATCHGGNVQTAHPNCTTCHGEPPSGTTAPNRDRAHSEHAVLGFGSVTPSCAACHNGANHYNGSTQVESFRPASSDENALAHQASVAAPAPTPVATVVRLRLSGRLVRSMSTRSVPPAMLRTTGSTTATTLESIENMYKKKIWHVWNAIASRNWRMEVVEIRTSVTCRRRLSNFIRD